MDGVGMMRLFVDGKPYETDIPVETPHMLFCGLLGRELLEKGRTITTILGDGEERHFVFSPADIFTRIDVATRSQYAQPLRDDTKIIVDGLPQNFALPAADELMHAVAQADAVAAKDGRRVVSVLCDGQEYYGRLYEPIGSFGEIVMVTQALPQLRKAVVTVAIGGAFDAVKERVYALMKAYAQKCGADFVAIETPSVFMPYPHCEKYQVFDLFSRYDRILYLDVDVLITPDAPDVFAVVPADRLGMFDEETFYSHLHEKEYAFRQLGPIDWKSGYYNSGVVCLSYQHRPLMAKAVRDTVFCAFMDQTIMNYRIAKRRYDVLSLPFRFNHMAAAGDDRLRSWFVHYAGKGFDDVDAAGAPVPRLEQMLRDAKRLTERIPMAETVRNVAEATDRFSSGKPLDERELTKLLFAEAMDLTNEHDLACGTRSLRQKYGFSAFAPAVHRGSFEEMTFKPGSRVLLVDLRMIGDAVHTGELCSAMKRLFDGIHLTLLCLNGAGSVVAGTGAIDALIDFSYGEYIDDVRLRGSPETMLFECGRVLAQIRAGGFDAAVNLNQTTLSMLFLRMISDVPVFGWSFDDANRAVFRGNVFHCFFTVNPGIHLAEQALRILPQPVGNGPRSGRALFSAAEGDPRVPQGAVGIFPGARVATRRWPKEYWAEVIKAVRRTYAVPVVIFGGKQDAVTAQGIVDLCGSDGVIDLCGEIPLSSLGAAMARLRALVSNDSGGKHVAVAGGVPVVEISGPGGRFDHCGPYGAWGLVLEAELDCLHCGKLTCEHCSCMTAVKPDAVFAALRALLFARDKAANDPTAVLDAVCREHTFDGLSVWFSGTRRPSDSLVYQPIRQTNRLSELRQRLWASVLHELFVAKNIALGCGIQHSRLTGKNIAMLLRCLTTEQKETVACDCARVDAEEMRTLAAINARLARLCGDSAGAGDASTVWARVAEMIRGAV